MISWSGTILDSWNSSEATGIKSVRRALPAGVKNLVSSTFDSGRYRLSVVCEDRGLIRQQPPRCGSSKAAKIAGLSNLGQHSQSIDPSCETSAAERQSPIIP